MLNRINTLLEGRSGRGLAVLGILCVSLILRGDEGCVTEDRSVEGVLALTVETEWETRGFTENTGTDGGTVDGFADDIISALDDLENVEDLQADKVTIAGARGRVTVNRGHDSARTATVTINTNNKVERTLLTMAVPDNSTGREVTASDTEEDLFLDLNATAIDALNTDFQDFLNAYLIDDLETARAILNAIDWSASWVSDDPPTSQDPDDFDWVTEVIIHVPIIYDSTVVSF